MKRIILLFILIFVFSQVKAQETTFAWISSPNIGSKNSVSKLDSVVHLLNNLQQIDYVFVTGNITQHGRNSEFETANDILQNLDQQYKIIPGKVDSKYTESGLLKFFDYWYEDNFIYETKKEVFIGLNSSLIWNELNGHFSPEVLNWLQGKINDIPPGKEIFLFFSQSFASSIDNNLKILTELNGKNLQAIFNTGNNPNRIEIFKDIPVIYSSVKEDDERNNIALSFFSNAPDTLRLLRIKNDTSLVSVDNIKKKRRSLIVKKEPEVADERDTTLIWRKDLKTYINSEPAIWRDKLFFGDYRGIITCLDTSGTKVWDYDAFGNILTKPIISDRVVTVSTVQGDIVTLNASSGESIQTIGFDETITSELQIIDYEGNKELMIPKRSNSKSALAFGTQSGKVYCYDLETLQEYWHNTNAKGPVVNNLFTAKNKIIFASRDGYVYCIDAREGWLIWKWKAKELEDEVFNPTDFITDGDNIYFIYNEKAASLNILLGKENWVIKKFLISRAFALSSDNSKIYIGGTRNNLYEFSASKGVVIREIKYKLPQSNFYSLENLGEDNFLLIKENGMVFSIKTNSKVKRVALLNKSHIYSIQKFDNNKYITSDPDGIILMLKLSKKDLLF